MLNGEQAFVLFMLAGIFKNLALFCFAFFFVANMPIL
jgi:hypothetical protein